MYARLFSLFTLFAALACLILSVSASPIVAEAALEKRTCRLGCKFVEPDAIESSVISSVDATATPVATFVPEATAAASAVETTAPECTEEPAAETTPEAAAALVHTSGALSAVSRTAFVPLAALSAVASTILFVL